MAQAKASENESIDVILHGYTSDSSVPLSRSLVSFFFPAGVIVAVAALVAWLLSPLVATDGWLTTLMLLIFAVGVQTLFFELIPLRYFHGRHIFSYNRWLWGALFAIAATVFLQTMLNPDGDFIRAFEQPNMVALAFVVVLFCVASTLVWVYFNSKRKKEA